MQRVDFATGSSPSSLAAGDFNGDGKPDLAVTTQAPARLSILLDTTPSGATTPTLARTDVTIAAPGLLAIGDLNGDGKPDVAVATSGTNLVSVFLNTTATGALTPTFAAPSDFPVATGFHAIAITDVNGDGKPDLAVTNAGGDNSVSVLLNLTPTGATVASFASKVDFATGSSPFSIAAGDLNGDTRADLVVSHVGGFRPVVALINTTQANAATPTFAAPATLLSHENTEIVRLADFNADGKPDLVVADANPVGALVFINTTAAGTTPPTFATPQLVVTGGTPTAFAFTDFDGDGKLDVVAPTGASTLALLLGTTSVAATTPSFRVKRDYATTSIASSVAIGDFNGDTKPDVAVANSTSGSLSVMLAE